jgi:hypothetical protein
MRRLRWLAAAPGRAGLGLGKRIGEAPRAAAASAPLWGHRAARRGCDGRAGLRDGSGHGTVELTLPGAAVGAAVREPGSRRRAVEWAVHDGGTGQVVPS